MPGLLLSRRPSSWMLPGNPCLLFGCDLLTVFCLLTIVLLFVILLFVLRSAWFGSAGCLCV